jgi:hypothetical protein
MKRIAFRLLIVGAMLMVVSPAGAKWLAVTKSKAGTWFVSDRGVTVQGDCKTVLVGLIYKKPMASRVPGRMALAKKYKARICCRARTYQLLAYVLVDTQKKNFYGRKLSAMAKPIKPRTVMDSLARRVCAPGFGAQAPAPVAKPPAKGVNQPAATDSYKRTCKYCSNSGGIWLCCTCKTQAGANKHSCLDPRKCQGRGISNCNGVLTCGKCK